MMGAGLFYKNGKLYFGGRAIESLAKRHGTPLYIYDLSRVRERVREHFGAFKKISIHYAIKANHNKDVLGVLRKEGAGLDVVSGGELKYGLGQKFKPAQIIFSGVAKTEPELELAIKKAIKLINVESPSELRRIAILARKLKKKVAVGIRFNPDVNAETHPYITTGFRENKFGMDDGFISELREILKKNQKQIELKAISLHIGSQLRQLDSLKEAISRTVPVYQEFKKEFPLSMFDVGGGLAIDYHDGKPPQAGLKEYGAMVESLLSGLNCEILCEPGRILVGDAGCLVTRVQYIKTTRHKTFVIVDTGMHHLMRPTLYQAYHRILPVKQREGKMKCDVVGPICESSDFLARDRELSKVEEGDLLVIGETGAYGYTMASHYNMHPFPKCVTL